MFGWWDHLTFALQFFYGVALCSTFILLLQMVLQLSGFGHDIHIGDMDMNGPAEHAGGLHILSVRTITAFFVGFGWMGVVSLKRNLSIAATLGLSVAVGGVFLLMVFSLMRSLQRMGSSGTMDYKNAIGKTGTVYLPIPAGRAGPGQVEIMIQGRLMVVQAFTKCDRPLANRSKVKVVEVIDRQTLLVEPAGT